MLCRELQKRQPCSGNALGIEIALKEMSIRPAFSTTASTYVSTACSSRASTCAASPTPPRPLMLAVTAFSLRKVTSTQKELRALASECACDRAANVPSGSVYDCNLVLENHVSSPVNLSLGSTAHVAMTTRGSKNHRASARKKLLWHLSFMMAQAGDQSFRRFSSRIGARSCSLLQDSGGRVSQMTRFAFPRLFPLFGLPAHLPSG